ncbi:MAG: hypothetical protein ACYTHJ_19670 [Planctomycetota bacterium]|jgi:hypothetical protein
MFPVEKVKLVGLFATDANWCQGAEARDANGDAVKFDDPMAIAWDITGALCLLFGWTRARTLFGQFERHVNKTRRVPGFNRDAAVESMVLLQAYYDRPDATFERFRGDLETMPVWEGGDRGSHGTTRKDLSLLRKRPEQ